VSGLTREFWEESHRRGGWLGGSSPEAVLRYHDIAPEGLRHASVTDLGVGTGEMSHHLVGLGAEVTSVDIAFGALDKSAAQFKFHTKDLKRAPGADVVICHLVTAHCEDDEVVRLLAEAPLKPRGFIALHSNEVLPDDDGGSPSRSSLVNQLRERILITRTPEEVRALAEQAGRTVVSVTEGPRFGAIRWWFFRLR
jgi:SAM-dependent methyltransferase